MSISVMRRALAMVLVASAIPAWAQPGGQATPGLQATTANAGQLTACVQSQRQAIALVDAGNRRLELARQTNDPAAMRAAVDEFQTTLSMVKTQLASCAELAATAPAAGHAMPTTQAPPSPPAASPPSSADPHAGHVMPTPAAAPAAKPAAPAATRPRTPAPPPTPPAPAADPHAGHAMPTPPTPPAATPAAPPAAEPELVEDPVSKTKVDPKTSLRVLYQGKMYYFRSDKERQEFMRNPGKYLSAK